MEYNNEDMNRLQQLFKRYYAGKATREEINELAGLVNEAGNNDLLPLLKNAWEQEEGEPVFSAKQSNALFQSIMQHQPHRIRPLVGWAAAAAVTGLIIAGFWLFLPSQKEEAPQQAQQTLPAPPDISPGKDGAVLTLSDGRKIILDNAGNGNIASEGNINVVKKDGQLQYDASQSPLATDHAPFNTMSTPRGRQYSVLLADGSKVWLNASSSITYPTAFAGKERRVQITGEAYFEVASFQLRSGQKLPFRVQLPNGRIVEVLGTKFNINSYADEEAIKTTLLEGSVKVQSAVLKPGEQATMQGAGLTIHNKVNLDEVMAWRNGFFSFNNTDLKTVLRQLSRWYDVDIVFEGKIDDVRFSGDIGRSLTLSQVLSILDDTRIHYTIEGKKLLIKP